MMRSGHPPDAFFERSDGRANQNSTPPHLQWQCSLSSGFGVIVGLSGDCQYRGSCSPWFGRSGQRSSCLPFIVCRKSEKPPSRVSATYSYPKRLTTPSNFSRVPVMMSQCWPRSLSTEYLMSVTTLQPQVEQKYIVSRSENLYGVSSSNNSFGGIQPSGGLAMLRHSAPVL